MCKKTPLRSTLCTLHLRSGGSRTPSVSVLPATTSSDWTTMTAHVSNPWLANVWVAGRSPSPLARGPPAGRCDPQGGQFSVQCLAQESSGVPQSGGMQFIRCTSNRPTVTSAGPRNTDDMSKSTAASLPITQPAPPTTHRIAKVIALRPRRGRRAVPTERHPRHRTLAQSAKLQDVIYEIRGPLHDHAARLETQGHRVMKLNIGNPAQFGFDAPSEIVREVIQALPHAQGYSDSKGILPARRAVVTRYELVKDFPHLDVEDVYLGNGVSELITMTLQALLDDGDQVLVPAPNYPLWTAATSLAGGSPVHYMCDETRGWQPDIADIEA